MGQHELFENKSESFSTKKLSDHIKVKRETVADRLKSFNLEKRLIQSFFKEIVLFVSSVKRR